MKNHNYKNKIVYTGIDVHKKTYTCVSICEVIVVKRDTMPAKPELLLRYLKNTFHEAASINTAYEAGFSGFHLHRYLVSSGINNIVVHPGSIEVASRDRVKTDKRDGLKIATQLAAGRLHGIFVPSLEREEKRSVSRLRSALMRKRLRAGQQIKALLFTQGLIEVEDETVLCEQWLVEKLNEVSKANFSDDFCFTINHYANQWRYLTQCVKDVEKRFILQAHEDNGLQQIYESVPGIGPIHARQLVNELGDMKQFRNEKRLFSYTGLTPSEHSSGERIWQGHITRQGNPELRHILVEAAWVAITEDPSLQEIMDRIARTSGKKRAIVGVARRLIARIRSCVLNGTFYEIKPCQAKDLLVQKRVA
jgi:transposase